MLSRRRSAATDRCVRTHWPRSTAVAPCRAARQRQVPPAVRPHGNRRRNRRRRTRSCARPAAATTGSAPRSRPNRSPSRRRCSGAPRRRRCRAYVVSEAAGEPPNIGRAAAGDGFPPRGLASLQRAMIVMEADDGGCRMGEHLGGGRGPDRRGHRQQVVALGVNCTFGSIRRDGSAPVRGSKGRPLRKPASATAGKPRRKPLELTRRVREPPPGSHPSRTGSAWYRGSAGSAPGSPPLRCGFHPPDRAQP